MASWQITPICDLETAVNRAPAAEWVLLCPPVHMEWLEWFAVVTNIPVQKLSCGSRSLVMVRHWFVCAEGKHAWQKKKKTTQLVKGTDFLFVLFELRSSLMLCSGVFLTSFLRPRHGCLSSGWDLWHKHKGDTHSQHQIWLFPTTPVIQQPQGLEDTSVSRCSSCHLHELHYLTALALINICCNLW